MEQEAEVEEEDVLPQMEVSGGKQGLVDERLRALLMLLNQVRVSYPAFMQDSGPLQVNSRRPPSGE